MVCGILYRGVCAGTGGLCSPDCGWGYVVVGVRGERCRDCVYVVFTVLHGSWVFSVVIRSVSGKGCVVWLKYFC